MSIALPFLILSAPFALAALLSWVADRSGSRQVHLGDRDAERAWHDADAIRTRFERQPFWPSSSATGERR